MPFIKRTGESSENNDNKQEEEEEQTKKPDENETPEGGISKADFVTEVNEYTPDGIAAGYCGAGHVERSESFGGEIQYRSIFALTCRFDWLQRINTVMM